MPREDEKPTRRMELNVWRAVAVAAVLLIAIVTIRFATMKEGGSTTVADGGGEIARKKYTCTSPNGTISGECATSRWDVIWHNLSWCSDLEAVCKVAGGTFTTARST